MAAQASTEIVVHRQLIRCRQASPNALGMGQDFPQQKSQSWQQLRKHLTAGGVTHRLQLQHTRICFGFIVLCSKRPFSNVQYLAELLTTAARNRR